MALTCRDLIKRGRALYGEQTALIFEERRFTFAEQAARMARLANALLGKGLRKQDRVAVLARNCSEYIECFGAGEIAGFVTINLNSRLAQPELAAICQDCQPSVLIYSAEFSAQANAIAAQVSSIRFRIEFGTGAANQTTSNCLAQRAPKCRPLRLSPATPLTLCTPAAPPAAPRVS
jgi:acyl-CoA synthetase (AMP-forming)/AMP-acid ligase II